MVEETPANQVRVTGGFNDFDFGYPLKPGESLETPAFYGGFTDRGFGESSRIMHAFERQQILPDHAAPHPRPVLYNSWEATTFDVNEAGQKQLADKAAKIGVELFVMDDGWFGARNDDHAGLGDWTVNPQEVPQRPEGAHRLRQQAGHEIRPVGRAGDGESQQRSLPRASRLGHALQRPAALEARNQLILNMARDDVREHIFAVLDKLVSGNHIEFLKWDMNRHFGEPGWPEAPVAEQKQLWVKYVENVYNIIDRLRAKHPGLEIESCSGGGGRADLGILKRVDEVWTSDNTEAFDRLRIQEGFSYAYAPKVMMAWVTDVPNLNGRSTPLKYRFLVAMQGSLGIGSNLNHWNETDFELASRMVALDKEIRGTVQQGNLYRLYSPREGEFTANEYVSQDGKQAVLFAFLHSQQYLRPMPIVYFRGLDEHAVYRIKPMDGKLQGRLETASGAYLMNHGVELRLTGDFDSTQLTLERLP